MMNKKSKEQKKNTKNKTALVLPYRFQRKTKNKTKKNLKFLILYLRLLRLINLGTGHGEKITWVDLIDPVSE